MLIDRRDAIALARGALRGAGRAAECRPSVSGIARRRAVQPGGSATDPDAIVARWTALAAPATVLEELLDARTAGCAERYALNVENFVGTVKVPVGVVGPIRVNGAHAHGDYYVPLATTEAALVASHNRGARIISDVGGCAAITISERVSRAPGFAFQTLHEAGEFIAWAAGALAEFQRVTEATSRYAQLYDLRISLEGNHVYLIFDFTCGDAAGQNMVTIATAAICEFIARQSPVRPQQAFLEANHSGDKKASAQSFLMGRGRSVAAEVWIPRDMIQGRLHTTPEVMVEYWTMSAIGGAISGTMGIQGHYANALAALFVACGQDVACVAESSVGITRMEVARSGLYTAVTLPNLVVGTVGGGTGLPSQRACLELLGLAGPGHANAFAEVCAAVALAGELSIVGALCAGEFAQAHQRLARAAARVKPEAPVHA